MKNPALKTALSRYQNSISILKKGYEQEKYRIASLSKSSLSSRKLKSIKSHHIAQYRDERLSEINAKTGNPISPSTVRLEMSLISHVFDIARIEWGVVIDNPVINVRKPKPPPGRTRRLTNREEKAILRYAHAYSNIEFYSIVIVALETAMRQGEILSMRWENVDLFKRIVHLPDTKNGTSRDVPLTTTVKDALIRLHPKPSGLVFNYTSRGLKSCWRTMLGKLKIENLRFHDLRHEAISRLFELSTLEMMEVAAISGHKSLSMLKRYTHLKAQNLVKKLDGNKNKSKQVVLNYLMPYPAYLLNEDGEFIISLPDFESIAVKSNSRSQVVHLAEDLLLRAIISKLKNGSKLPKPNEYLETHKGELIIVDPIGSDRVFDKVLEKEP